MLAKHWLCHINTEFFPLGFFWLFFLMHFFYATFDVLFAIFNLFSPFFFFWLFFISVIIREHSCLMHKYDGLCTKCENTKINENLSSVYKLPFLLLFSSIVERMGFPFICHSVFVIIYLFVSLSLSATKYVNVEY